MRQNIIALVERHIGRGRFSGESNIMLRCPFHKGGQEHKPSFSVNVDLGLFNCFTCHRTGNIIRLLKMLGLPAQVVDAETKGIRKEIDENRERLKWKKRKDWVTRDPHLAETPLPEIFLQPYLHAPDGNGGTVRVLPVKLMEAGFDPNWLNYMEIGFDRANNRITYPIRDIYGNLAGIAGGAVIAGQYPKYKVYQGRRKDPITNRWIPSDYGPWFDEKFPDYDFSNHDYLWNFEQVYPRLFFGKDDNATLIIVEGYKACLWLLQHGWWNTVALMGSSMSERQSSLLHRLRVKMVLFLDQDEAGRKATRNIGRELRKQQPGVFVAHYPYAEECQPDDLSQAELTASITGSLTYSQWMKETQS